LLDLQARRAGAPEVRDALSTASRRLVTISAAHEMLNGARENQRVPMGVYLARLRDLHAGSTPGVVVKFDCDVTACAPQTAVPLGLLISEAVMNSLKHGFPDGRTGALQVRLAAAGPDHLELTIHDDGVGCDLAAGGQGLGGAIIRRFAQQLRGKLTITSTPGDGYELRVRFPRQDCELLDAGAAEYDRRLA
jgi:two-component sensor histidine kinase